MNPDPKKKLEDESLYIFGVYTRIIDAIKHYDGIQTTYRTMSSTLLLASFGAIGFLFSSKIVQLPFDKLIGVLFICITALGAITILAMLDLVFQERLLIANFIEAIKLERKYKWLPQIHHNMLHKGVHHSAPHRKVLFYIGCSVCLIILGGLAAIYIVQNSNLYYKILMVVIVFVALISHSYLLLKLTGRFENLVRKILIEKQDNERI